KRIRLLVREHSESHESRSAQYPAISAPRCSRNSSNRSPGSGRCCMPSPLRHRHVRCFQRRQRPRPQTPFHHLAKGGPGNHWHPGRCSPVFRETFRPPTPRRSASRLASYRCPSFRGCRVLELNLIVHIGPGNRAERIRQPHKQVPKPEFLELQRLSHCNLFEGLEVGAFHAYGNEGKLLSFFVSVDSLRGFFPGIGGRAIGDEKYPGAIVRNSICFVDLFSLLQQGESL